MCSWSMFFSPFVFRTRYKRTGGTSDVCHPRISVVLGRAPERKILWIDRGARPVIVSVKSETERGKQDAAGRPRRRGRLGGFGSGLPSGEDQTAKRAAH